ncbi:MAG: lysophospholipid acyltransferase family protein [Candidatus Cloacimonadales bacterium]|nr:lysophospholipid acyltransferase family protein [Candidatus Cloacimonadales bacterium]
MKTIRSAFIWFIGFLYFGLMCLFVSLLTYFFSPRKLDPLVCFLFRIFLKILFIKVEVEGIEKIDRNKTYILMSNHVSLFDVPLLKGYIPVYFVGIEAEHQFSWPLYGWMVKRLNTIPINRESVFSSIRSIHKAQKVLKDGVSVCILPEGHRTLDGELRTFKKLPFHFLKEANVDLVPIGLSGLFALKPKKSWHIKPSTIKIKFGEVISREHLAKLTIAEMKEEAFQQIKSLIEYP